MIKGANPECGPVPASPKPIQGETISGVVGGSWQPARRRDGEPGKGVIRENWGRSKG